MKFKNCLKCTKPVSKNCLLGYCSKCRDRSGERNPFYGKTHKTSTIEEMKKKTRIASTNLWKKEDYRKKIILGVSKPRKDTFSKEQSKRMTSWYENNPNQKKIRSISMKEAWISGKIEPNINSQNESKLECEFRETLKKALPNKNVRKEVVKIKNRWFYPDIKIDNDIIIEFNGDYWHANPKNFKPTDIVHHGILAKSIWEADKKRIKTLEESGYKVFVVWQDEYKKNKAKAVERIVSCIKG